jgi:hypothetical protein
MVQRLRNIKGHRRIALDGRRDTGTMTNDDLLNATDYAQFKAKDEAWFLGAAGRTIRDYCKWHIAPIKSDLNVRAKIGNKGIIMLPTMNLVSVEAVRLNGATLTSEVWEADPAGFLVYHGYAGRRAYGYAVSVDITHGFEELPQSVAEVGYELTGRTVEHPSGVVKHMTRGPTDIDFLEFGSVLSDDQKIRLGPYRIIGV